MKKILLIALLASLATPALAEEKMDHSKMEHDAIHHAKKNTEKKADKETRKILCWVAPMDPEYRRDKPGKSPMGMDLVPVYEDVEYHEAKGDK